jgi:5-methylthioadenosine/S-adenosylhomocysteine deaminase
MTASETFLVSARWVIPVVPENTVWNEHCIAVRDGEIIDHFPAKDIASSRYCDWLHHQLDDHILLPGLINCHGHAPMTLLRGFADDLPLMEWLEHHIWPAENKWVDEEFVHDGTLLAIAEMLKSGTTTFSDMYLFAAESARAALQANIRCQVCAPVLESPTQYAASAEEYLHKALQIQDDFKHQELIEVVFGPHAPFTVSDDTFSRMATLANELDMGIQIHLHETSQEVDDSVKLNGLRPINRLEKLNILTPKTQCVHMTSLTEEDMNTIQTLGCHVIHCPESNMKLASGVCPVNQLTERGINVALGTDSAASNDDLDLFGEIKAAALLAKTHCSDPSVLDAHSALRMATINGARALGLEHLTGSLEKGKRADLCAVNINHIEAQPVYSPISSLVYTASGRRVDHVWVDGEHLLENGELKHLHEMELISKAREWHQKISPQHTLDK